MKKKTIYILVSVILVCIIVKGMIAIKHNNTKNTPVKEKVTYKKVSTQKTTEKIKKEENIVFLGDSIMDYYPIEKIFVDLPIVNSGIAGYKTTDILDNLEDMVYKFNPTSVFILIGTNDLMKESSEEKEKEVENNIKQMTEKIQKNRKNAKIYIQSIYPVNKDINASVVRERDNDSIKKINENIKDYCKKNDYTYIDLYSELDDEDGNFSKDYTEDGLHPNDLGYAKISQILAKEIYNIK